MPSASGLRTPVSTTRHRTLLHAQVPDLPPAPVGCYRLPPTWPSERRSEPGSTIEDAARPPALPSSAQRAPRKAHMQPSCNPHQWSRVTRPVPVGWGPTYRLLTVPGGSERSLEDISVVALITRRSQVQILSLPPRKPRSATTAELGLALFRPIIGRNMYQTCTKSAGGPARLSCSAPSATIGLNSKVRRINAHRLVPSGLPFGSRSAQGPFPIDGDRRPLWMSSWVNWSTTSRQTLSPTMTVPTDRVALEPRFPPLSRLGSLRSS